MMNQCANPNCCKPLHYLREGRVFVFDVPDPASTAKTGKPNRRMEHYWLCGTCSQTLMLRQSSDTGVCIASKPMQPRRAPMPVAPQALAS